MYKKYLGMYMKSAFQYRGSTILIAISQLLITLAEISSIYLLFLRFKTIGGWGFPEVAIMFGVIMTCFPLSECFGRGFDQFSKQLKTGGLDRILIRPRSVFWQVFSSDFEFSKIGRLIVGISSLCYGLIQANIVWTVAKVICIIFVIIAGFLINLSLLIINAGITIYTIEDFEVLNILTNGGRDLAQYPISIYKKWFRNIFTYILPLATINYLPVMYLIDAPGATVLGHMLAPVWGSLLIIPSVIFFNFSLGKYQGAGT